MVEITLLKIELDGDSFTATAPFGRPPGDGEAGGEAGETDRESAGERGKLIALAVGLGFLVAVAVLAKRRVGGPEEPTDEPGSEHEAATPGPRDGP